MKRGISIHLALTFLVFLTGRAGAQGVFVYDQQSSTNEIPNPILGVIIQQYTPLGQSFTPTFSSIGFVRLKLYDFNPGNGLGASLTLNLRSNSITGPVLAQAVTVTLPDGFADVVVFLFPAPVSLAPGTNYVFEPVVQSGDSWKIDLGPYNYPGGMTISQGVLLSGSDLWFREGIIVPEPTSPALVSIAVLIWAARSKSKSFGLPKATLKAHALQAFRAIR
jgi:hypothetical protein